MHSSSEAFYPYFFFHCILCFDSTVTGAALAFMGTPPSCNHFFVKMLKSCRTNRPAVQLLHQIWKPPNLQLSSCCIKYGNHQTSRCCIKYRNHQPFSCCIKYWNQTGARKQHISAVPGHRFHYHEKNKTTRQQRAMKRWKSSRCLKRQTLWLLSGERVLICMLLMSQSGKSCVQTQNRETSNRLITGNEASYKYRKCEELK